MQNDTVPNYLQEIIIKHSKVKSIFPSWIIYLILVSIALLAYVSYFYSKYINQIK